MATMANDSRVRSQAGTGLGSRSPRRRRSGSPGRWRAGCSTRAGRPEPSSWPAWRRRARRRAARRPRAARALGRPAGERGLLLLFGARAGRRRAVRLLLGGGADGRRPGAADRVHGARRRGRVAVAAPRRAPGPADGRRRGARRARPGARAGPPVGRRPRAGRRALGAGRDGLRRVVLRARREAARGPAARGAGRRRPGDRGAACSPCWAPSASCRCTPRRPRRSTPAAPLSWWLPLLGLGVVTAGLAYCTGIAASRRLGSRLSSFVALLEVVAGVTFAWLLLDQLPTRAAARRRGVDHRGRGRGQARRAAARSAGHDRLVAGRPADGQLQGGYSPAAGLAADAQVVAAADRPQRVADRSARDVGSGHVRGDVPRRRRWRRRGWRSGGGSPPDGRGSSSRRRRCPPVRGTGARRR